MEKIRIYSFKTSERPDLYEKALGIRKDVFIEEQNVDPAIEIENEDQAYHYLLISDGAPEATARWRETPGGIKLERFATVKGSRNKGLGAMILKAVLDDILPLNKKIYLHAQARVVSFYLRHGFGITGEKFIEANIEHYPMKYIKS
jgi:predicted GNAT family N-acyltransferase